MSRRSCSPILTLLIWYRLWMRMLSNDRWIPSTAPPVIGARGEAENEGTVRTSMFATLY